MKVNNLKKTKILIQFSVVLSKIEFKNLIFYLIRIPTFQIFFITEKKSKTCLEF